MSSGSAYSPILRTRARELACAGLAFLWMQLFPSSEALSQPAPGYLGNDAVRQAQAIEQRSYSGPRGTEFPLSTPAAVFRFDDEVSGRTFRDTEVVPAAAFETGEHDAEGPEPYSPRRGLSQPVVREPTSSSRQVRSHASPADSMPRRGLRGDERTRITATPGWPDPPPDHNFDVGTLLAGVVRGSIVVAILLGATLWCLRWWMKNKSGALSGNHGLSVVGSLVLAGRCHLQLVDARGSYVLVGLDATGIKCVTILPEQFESSLDSAAEKLDQRDAA